LQFFAFLSLGVTTASVVVVAIICPATSWEVQLVLQPIRPDGLPEGPLWPLVEAVAGGYGGAAIAAAKTIHVDSIAAAK
jgi:hypothetical protein